MTAAGATRQLGKVSSDASSRMRTGARTGARRISKKEALRRYQGFMLIVGVAMICLLIVFMAAFAANLRRENTQLQKDNEYLQSEIDSLNDQIGEATNVDQIEKVATEEYGMVHPDSQNCIAISTQKNTNSDLAATIKDEAYS